jgi:hypothetical protein
VCGQRHRLFVSVAPTSVWFLPNPSHQQSLG